MTAGQAEREEGVERERELKERGDEGGRVAIARGGGRNSAAGAPVGGETVAVRNGSSVTEETRREWGLQLRPGRSLSTSRGGTAEGGEREKAGRESSREREREERERKDKSGLERLQSLAGSFTGDSLIVPW